MNFPFDEEMAFRGWYVPLSMKLGIAPNPDDPEHYYDFRRFYQDMKAGKPGVISPDRPGGHFPSDYKLPGHPRTYLNDGLGRIFDTRTTNYLDNSPVPSSLLKSSESSPDMPNFEPGLATLLVNSVKAK